MDIVEKLRVMLPHWIEHNKGHGTEFSQWAAQLTETDADLADQLNKAVASLNTAQKALEKALEIAGGPLAGHRHEEHHHHH